MFGEREVMVEAHSVGRSCQASQITASKPVCLV